MPPEGFDAFKRALIQQETGGRYGISNTQGSGAVGIGQVMPATGKALASRIGVAWRPDLMSGMSQAARDYQDAITHEAALEAWRAGNGNPIQAAMYYHGGSDRQKWGEKTRRYANEVIGRMN